MTWQFKRPENGLIDGKTRHEWQGLGVTVWVVRRINELPSIYSASPAFGDFAPDHQYAPGTLDGLPAPWPELWQWRKLEAEMDTRTWEAASLWQCGGRNPTGPRHSGDFCFGSQSNVSAKGEWWAPSDQDGNPCDWPEVEPQPVVVIPAAEMTPLVLYGHQAMGGTWRWKDGTRWEIAGGSRWEVCDGEQWAPCDERGVFCELRRVVSDTSAEVERRRVDDLDEALRRAQKEEGWWREEAKRQESAKSKVEAQLEVARREVAALHEEVDDAHRRLNLLELIAEARKRGAHARRDGGSGVSGFYRRMRCGISEIVISIPNTESDAVAQKMAAELRRYAAEVEDAAVDRLNTDRGRMMARADAMDPDSDTARQIAGIDSQLTAIEEREARKMRAALEERRIMPIDAGATLDSKMRAALEENY